MYVLLQIPVTAQGSETLICVVLLILRHFYMHPKGHSSFVVVVVYKCCLNVLFAVLSFYFRLCWFFVAARAFL